MAEPHASATPETGAEQLAVTTPSLHVQLQGPDPVTAEGTPKVHMLAVGTLGTARPSAAPHAAGAALPVTVTVAVDDRPFAAVHVKA